MNPSSKPRLAALAALMSALVLAGCAAPGPRPDAGDDPASPQESVIGDVGQSVEARYLEALDLMKRNQFDDAQAAFEALAQEAPEASGPPTNLGILHLRAKRLPQARPALQQAVQINPENAVAWHELGRTERQLNNPAGARDAYLQALALDDQLAEAHLNLGLVLDQPLNDVEGALTHYRRYLALTGSEDLRVLVWIAELERKAAPDTAGQNEGPPP